MKNLKSRLFGPRNINEATKKIVGAKPKKVYIRLEQRANENGIRRLNGDNVDMQLNVRYKIIKENGKIINFDLKIPYIYDFGDSYGGDKKNFHKSYRIVREQINSLEERGIHVTPFGYYGNLMDKDFDIILNDEPVKKK